MMESLMVRQMKSLLEEEPYFLPALANASALINETLEDLNWAGFYLVRNDALLLGPFQGKTACVNIPRGKGVCGTAYEKDETQLVKDVHEFPGHIACDSASNSEIVIPIHHEGKVVAVLDIDSPLFDRFSEVDRKGLESFAKTLEEIIEW